MKDLLTMRTIYLTVVGLSFLGIFTVVNCAPVNISGNKSGFMEVMYDNLSKRNLSKWIFPPKEESGNKSALFEQVDKSCQKPRASDQTEDSEMPPIYYVCASMLDTINHLWETVGIVKLIEDNQVQLPSKLDDLYKEEDLKNASDFCSHFSKKLNTDDFSKDLSPFLNNFISNEAANEKSNCKTLCRNAENKSVIYLGDVNPVCAIWRKGYYIYKEVTGTKTEKMENLSPKPIEAETETKKSVDAQVATILENEHEAKAKEHENDFHGETSTKNKLLVAPDPDAQLQLAVTSKGKQLPLQKPLVEEISKTPDIDEITEDEKLGTKDEQKSAQSVTTQEKDKTPSQKEDEATVKEKLSKKTNGVPQGGVSSSTQSTDVVAEDPPMPPVAKDQAPSSPKPAEKPKDKSSSVPIASQQPESKLTDFEAVIKVTKVEQQNQNEAPPDADYDDGDGMPPPNINDKTRIDDATDDDSALDTIDQNRKKPKPSDSLSVSVSKEKHAGDNIEVDKVSIEGDSATVNVEFNEQSDPGVINYFVCFLGLLAILYLLFHNKKRLIAYVVEGRKPQAGRRRSSSTQYRKLENNYD